MKVIDQLFGQPDVRRATMARLNATASARASQRDLQNLLLAYSLNIGLYDWLTQNRYEAGTSGESLKGIRTPCAEIEDFYVSVLWSGDLEEAFPIDTDHEAILEPIEQIWEWSNWANEKDVAVRAYARYGDLFIKCIPSADAQQVRLELVEPQHVSDFTEESGLLKMIRLDIPQSQTTAAGITEWRTHTEVWDKATQTYRRWLHEQGLDAPLDQLGEPEEELSLMDFGADFVPFVHAKFRAELGDKWGMGAYTHLLDKIDELNRKATRHSELMFTHLGVSWQLTSNNMDGNGRPMPAPTLANDTDGIVTLGQERFFKPPSGWRVEQMVPDLNYAAYLATIESEVHALQRAAPEMLYSSLVERGELSGRALRYMLMPAISKAERARATADRILIRAHMMLLTMAKNLGLPIARGIGTYEAGQFDHRFEKRDILPVDAEELAATRKLKAETGILLKQLGYTDAAIQREEFGLTDQEIQEMAAERETQAEDAAEAMLTAMERQQPVAGRGVPANGAVPTGSAPRA